MDMKKCEIIAVDFDGTLCENQWPEIGAANEKLIARLKNLKEKEGVRLILWTNRVDDKLEAAVNWCKEQGLEFDAVNDNLPEIIEEFGSNCRKIFANRYIDDRADRSFDLPFTAEKGWAETEVELACKRERNDSGFEEGEWDYGSACYESALKAYHSLCEDGHSGFSIGLTKQILNRLIEGKPLTPIEDTDDVWEDVGHYNNDKLGTKFQCKRMSALFKDVLEDGTVKYIDVDRYYCVDINSGATYTLGLIGKIIDEIDPITMPYIPQDKPYIFYCEDFVCGTDNNDRDNNALGILYMKNPKGERVEINRFFREVEGENGLMEITAEEYYQRKAAVAKKEEE